MVCVCFQQTVLFDGILGVRDFDVLRLSDCFFLKKLCGGCFFDFVVCRFAAR